MRKKKKPTIGERLARFRRIGYSSQMLSISLGISTFLLALLVFGVQGRMQEEIKAAEAEYNISKFSADELAENRSKDASFDENAISPLTEEVIEASRKHSEEHGLPMIGAIAIPDVELNLPIFHGLSDFNVTYGAATVTEGQVMGEGNYALASHHVFQHYANGLDASQLLFSPLERAETGMLVYITDKNTVYTYRITEKKVVKPTQTEVLDTVPGKSLLTLITCTDFRATNRIIVNAELVSSESYGGENAKVFEGKYTSY